MSRREPYHGRGRPGRPRGAPNGDASARGMVRCQLARLLEPGEQNHFGAAAVRCGALLFPRERARHLAELHGLDGDPEQHVGAFEAAVDVPDDKEVDDGPERPRRGRVYAADRA